jgi:site-specific DNA-methyltransferase (adenine-specific)
MLNITGVVTIGLNTITQGNCLDLLPRVRSASVDMVLCDLPYGTTQNKWDSVLDLTTLWEHYWRILKPTGVVALTASQPFTSTLLMSQRQLFRHEWIWIKNRGSNFANTVREPMKEHESILIFSRGKWTYNKQMQERTGGGKALVGAIQKSKGGATDNYGDFAGRDITLSELRVPSSWQKFTCEVGLHPTQKPVPLFEYMIRTYTNEGDIVLDNCCGSGTTGVACQNTGRNFIQFELSPEYCEIASNRLQLIAESTGVVIPAGVALPTEEGLK